MKVVALTFDDGVIQQLKIARMLSRLNIRATFFIIACLGRFEGKETLVSHPEYLQEIAGTGHEVGSHTCTHRDLTKLSPSEVSWELKNSKKKLEDIIGKEVLGFAYPCGLFDGLRLPLVELSANKVQYVTQFLKQPRFVISVGTLSPLKLAALTAISRRVIAYIAVEGPVPVPRSIRWLANNTNRLIIVTPSNYVKSELSVSGLKVRYVIPHGIAFDKICFDDSLEDSVKHSITDDKVKILVVASSSQLRKFLGIVYFMYAWSKLPSKVRENSFIIIKVPGELKRRVEVLARSLGINSGRYIILDAYLTPCDMFSLYRLADLYVHQTLSDGFRLPILESLASGTPVIVLDAGPWNEIVNEYVGWLVKVAREKLVYENNLPYRLKIPDIREFSRKLNEAIERVKFDSEVLRSKCVRRASNFEAHKVYRMFKEII